MISDCVLFVSLNMFFMFALIKQIALVYSLKLLYTMLSKQKTITCLSIDQHSNGFQFFLFIIAACPSSVHV